MQVDKWEPTNHREQYYCSQCSRHYNDERPWHIQKFVEWGMCGKCYITRDERSELGED